jgi:Na+/H+ antiporter NhaC
LLISTVLAVIIYAKGGFLPEFVGLLLKEMADPTIGWVILVCGLMSAMLFILEKSNAATAFADALSKFATTRKRALFSTWLLGICLFIDDYLNVLTVGNTMKKVTDRHRISRSMLAYSVGSTAAPIVILVPISTWAVFFSSLLDGEGVVGADGTAFGAYVQCVPYLFYGWICVFVVLPLVIFGVLPLVGPLKRQELDAMNNGNLFPPGVDATTEAVEESNGNLKKGGILDFVLPLVVLIAATILSGKDLLMGVIIALVFTGLLYVTRKLVSLTSLIEQFWSGFAVMIQVFGLLVLAFSFKDACANLGFVEYVIDAVAPIMAGAWLPAVVFIATAGMAFAMANFWGLAAIVVPIVVPLSAAMNVDIFLSSAAVFSGAAFGSHACFYADAAILIGQATNIRPYDHAITQLPYAILSAIIATVLYGVIGFIQAS